MKKYTLTPSRFSDLIINGDAIVESMKENHWVLKNEARHYSSDRDAGIAKCKEGAKFAVEDFVMIAKHYHPSLYRLPLEIISNHFCNKNLLIASCEESAFIYKESGNICIEGRVTGLFYQHLPSLDSDDETISDLSLLHDFPGEIITHWKLTDRGFQLDRVETSNEQLLFLLLQTDRPIELLAEEANAEIRERSAALVSSPVTVARWSPFSFFSSLSPSSSHFYPQLK